MTKQRELILAIVRDNPSHLTAEDVFDLARQQMPTIVRATVYNNLNYLSENGLIRRVRMHGGPDRFDGVLEPHEHLVVVQGRSGIQIHHRLVDEAEAFLVHRRAEHADIGQGLLDRAIDHVVEVEGRSVADALGDEVVDFTNFLPCEVIILHFAIHYQQKNIFLNAAVS